MTADLVGADAATAVSADSAAATAVSTTNAGAIWRTAACTRLAWLLLRYICNI